MVELCLSGPQHHSCVSTPVPVARPSAAAIKGVGWRRVAAQRAKCGLITGEPQRPWSSWCVFLCGCVWGRCQCLHTLPGYQKQSLSCSLTAKTLCVTCLPVCDYLFTSVCFVQIWFIHRDTVFNANTLYSLCNVQFVELALIFVPAFFAFSFFLSE